MEKILTVPWSRQSRKAYRVAMRDRQGGQTKPALTAADSYLEIIASRSSALASCYAVFLALISVMFGATASHIAHWILLVSGTGIATGMLLLFHCLWIKWAPDPRVYQHPVREYRRTIDMVCDLSIRFNVSIVIAIFSFLVGLAASALNWIATTSTASDPVSSASTLLAVNVALNAVDRCPTQNGDAQTACYWTETARLSRLAARATNARPAAMTEDQFAEMISGQAAATILQMKKP